MVLPVEFFAVALNDCVVPTLMVGDDGETVTVTTVLLSVTTPRPVTGPVSPEKRPSLVSQASSARANAADAATTATCRDRLKAMRTA